MLLSLIHITVIDVIDILIVAFLLYKLYQLIKGTAAMKIFFGIAIIYFVWLLVKALKMELLESIMGQVIGVGVIVLIIVFQQEVRQFLLMLGDRYLKRGALLGKVKLISDFSHDGVDSIVQASVEMAETKTGALIVIARETSLQSIIQTGEKLNADINTQLIKAIFYKNAPLHDGAMIIEKNKIIAAKCILPVSQNPNLPNEYGLRHRSGLGMSENSTALVVIVSEQSGNISVAQNGKIHKVSDGEHLRRTIVAYLRKKNENSNASKHKASAQEESEATQPENLEAKA